MESMEFIATATSYNTSLLRADSIFRRVPIRKPLKSIHRAAFKLSQTDDIWYIWKDIIYLQSSTQSSFFIWFTNIAFVLAQKTNIVLHFGSSCTKPLAGNNKCGIKHSLVFSRLTQKLVKGQETASTFEISLHKHVSSDWSR